VCVVCFVWSSVMSFAYGDKGQLSRFAYVTSKHNSNSVPVGGQVTYTVSSGTQEKPKTATHREFAAGILTSLADVCKNDRCWLLFRRQNDRSKPLAYKSSEPSARTIWKTTDSSFRRHPPSHRHQQVSKDTAPIYRALMAVDYSNFIRVAL
jgi:hypothetical protein